MTDIRDTFSKLPVTTLSCVVKALMNALNNNRPAGIEPDSDPEAEALAYLVLYENIEDCCSENAMQVIDATTESYFYPFTVIAQGGKVATSTMTDILHQYLMYALQEWLSHKPIELETNVNANLKTSLHSVLETLESIYA